MTTAQDNRYERRASFAGEWFAERRVLGVADIDACVVSAVLRRSPFIVPR
jgi:hypothetical protein